MGCGNSNSLKEKQTHANNNNLIPSRIKSFKDKNNTNKSCKNTSYKGVTILKNVPDNLPETITRDEVKDMVYDALKINEDKNKGKGKLNAEQIDGIIDMIMTIVSPNKNKKIEDKRLDDLKAIIGFYDADKENVKKLFFKDQKPTDEEIEDKLNDLVSMNEDAKLFAIEIQN